MLEGDSLKFRQLLRGGQGCTQRSQCPPHKPRPRFTFPERAARTYAHTPGEGWLLQHCGITVLILHAGLRVCASFQVPPVRNESLYIDGDQLCERDHFGWFAAMLPPNCNESGTKCRGPRVSSAYWSPPGDRARDACRCRSCSCNAVPFCSAFDMRGFSCFGALDQVALTWCPTSTATAATCVHLATALQRNTADLSGPSSPPPTIR